MVKVGDRIALASNAATREGLVIALSGSLIRVRWDSGAETNVIPGPGTLSVVALTKPSPKNPKASKKPAPSKKAKPAKAKGKKAR